MIIFESLLNRFWGQYYSWVCYGSWKNCIEARTKPQLSSLTKFSSSKSVLVDYEVLIIPNIRASARLYVYPAFLHKRFIVSSLRSTILIVKWIMIDFLLVFILYVRTLTFVKFMLLKTILIFPQILKVLLHVCPIENQ